MNIVNINDTSNKLFYVGGVVRDELLGRESFDVDITYVGNAIEYCSQFGEVIQENPDFGTVRVKLSPSSALQAPSSTNGEKDEVIADFASTRSESYPQKGYLPVVDKIGCSLKEDVMRRDFTINALAKSITTGEIIDYVGGLEDLKNKKLKVLHDESFIDDPTRIIRGLKFAIRFGFELDEHTKQLQDKYLANINYDMSYKRVKKELIETFSLLNLARSGKDGAGQHALEKFINEGIYKLVTPDKVNMPKVNVEDLVNKYLLPLSLQQTSDFPKEDEMTWLVYVGILGDLSRLPLTRIEQKIITDVPQHKLNSDFELYKAFENSRIESVLLYAILRDEIGAKRYLDNLRKIKISITGKDLQTIGIAPSPKYQKIFDEILKIKLQKPNITKDDELKIVNDLNEN